MEVGEKACFVVRKSKKCCFNYYLLWALQKKITLWRHPFLATYHNPYAPANTTRAIFVLTRLDCCYLLSLFSLCVQYS